MENRQTPTSRPSFSSAGVSASSSVTAFDVEAMAWVESKKIDLRVAGTSVPCDESNFHQNTQLKGWLARIRFGVFNVHCRLFTLMIMANAVPLICLLATNFQNSADFRGHLNSLIPLCIHMAAGNAMVCTGIRSPLVINAMFLAFGAIPRSAPLWLRRRAAKIYHFGGVHKGTGIACCVWMVTFVVLFSLLSSLFPPRGTVLPTGIYFTSILVTVVLIVVAAMGHPNIRRRYHDTFELTHRFGGWFALILLWVTLFLQAQLEILQGLASSMGMFLVTFPTFWFLIVATVAAIWPWTMLRRVEVKPEKLSNHATRLHFRYRETSWGRGLSLAKHPLRDWHSFAAFTDRFDDPEYKFSCLVSNAGDWTKSVIQDEPTKLWVRAIPAYGFGYAMNLFNRILVVTTGSGIGPCLSFIGSDDMPAMRVVWQTRNPLQTYGQRTLDLIKRLDTNPVILDTTVCGRVDMLPMVCNMAQEFQAEAVMVISNPSETKRLVFNLELKGVPAYGPIFDS